MTHLKNFSRPRQTTVWRVICIDDADIQAAVTLGYKITEEWLQGKQQKVAFSSLNKAEAASHQQILNNAANKIRLPKGSDPIIVGERIKKEKQSSHRAHQELRAATLQKRQNNYRY